MELIKACEDGDLNKVIFLIERGDDINTRDEINCTPLHIACYYKYVKIGIFLLEKGAKINTKTYSYTTPLHAASDSGCIELATLLLEKGANINAKDEYRQTPLHCASSGAHPGLVTLLLEKGANINALNSHDESPMDNAIRNECFCKLPMDNVIKNNCFEVIKILLKKGATIDDNMLKYIDDYNNVELMKILLENDHNTKYDHNDRMVASTLNIIKLEKLSQKINILSGSLKDIYGMEPNDEFDTLEILDSMLKYSPDNKKQVDLVKANFDKIGETYF